MPCIHPEHTWRVFAVGVWFELQRGRHALFSNPTPKLFLTAQNGIVFPPGSDSVELFIESSSRFPESLTGPIDIGVARHFGQEDQPENIASAIINWDRDVFG